MNYRSVEVAPQAAGMRVDRYLAARFEGWSRSAVARAIREGQVCSTGRELRPSSLLRDGEELRITVPALAPEGPPPPCPPVLHIDRRLVAFSKPAGMLCHPVGRRFAWGLINLARRRLPGERLHLVHRLDRGTSGVLVLARDRDANRLLKEAFKRHLATKAYLAVVRGVVPWRERVLDGPIGRDAGSPIRLRQAVRPDGRPACTSVRVLRRLEGRSLVLCRPVTGRTHQLRVHLDHAGFPVLGDRIYGQDSSVFLSILAGRPPEDFAERLGWPRQCLHAWTLRLPHPDGGEIELRAPPPEDFVQAAGGPVDAEDAR